MSANPKAVAHYRAAEDHARDVEKARKTIHALRMQLHECISELQDISLAFKGENEEWNALIQRSKDTLLDTLPGAELDALDAMSQPERRETLRDAMFDIAMSAATFEAQHTGPLNWSGKELK